MRHVSAQGQHALNCSLGPPDGTYTQQLAQLSSPVVLRTCAYPLALRDNCKLQHTASRHVILMSEDIALHVNRKAHIPFQMKN